MPGETIRLVDLQGQIRDVPVEAAAGALDAGWRTPTTQQELDRTTGQAREESYGGVGGAVAAGLAGAARGVSLGLSDVAARAIGGEDAAIALEGYREENPGISLGSEIVGGVAPALLSGGAGTAGALGRAAAATPAGAASRLGARLAATGRGGSAAARYGSAALGGVTEGVLQGVGAGATELALSTDPLSVERAASVLSSNMLFGGALGGAAGGVGHAAERVLMRAKGGIDRHLLARSEDSAMRAVDALDAEAVAQPSAVTDTTDLAILDRKGLDAAEALELEAIDAARLPERQQFVDDLTEFRREVRDAGIPKVTSGAADRDAREAGKRLLKAEQDLMRATDNPDRLLNKPEQAMDALQRQRHVLEEVADWMDNERAAIERRIRDGRNEVMRDLLAGKIKGENPAAMNATGRALAVEREYERRFAEYLGPLEPMQRVDPTSATSATDAAPAPWREIVYPKNIDRGDEIDKMLERNQEFQERIAKLIATPESDRLLQIESARQALDTKRAPALEPDVSVGRELLSVGASFAGPLGAIAGRGWRAIEGLRAAAGAVAERAGRVASRFLDATSKAAGSDTARVLASKTLTSLAFAPRDEKQPTETELHKLWKQRTDEVMRLTAYDETGTPRLLHSAREAMAAQLRAVGVVSPVLADKLETAGARRIEYLSSIIPRRPDIAGMQIGPDNWRPSDMAMRSWARSAAAVEDPIGVLERAVDGSVTPEDSAALRAVYPELLADFTRTVTEQLPELRATLPYHRKLALSILTGVPVDPAMDPRVLRVLQDQFPAEQGSAGGTQAPKAMPQFGSLQKSPDQPTPAQARGAA